MLKKTFSCKWNLNQAFLTFITLRANAATEKIMLFFSFSLGKKKKNFEISGKETVLHESQSVFPENNNNNNKYNNKSKCRLLKILPTTQHAPLVE